jgi:hypothetical protein
MYTGWLSKKLENRHVSRETLRNYIGSSSIGASCLRQVYYDFNNHPGNEISKRLQRTFDIGSTLEGLIISWLQDCGLELELPDEENRFLEFKDEELPYFKGHCDALIIDPKAILEIKTASNSTFKTLIGSGCKAWNGRYYAQVQSYMGMSGLTESCILVLNKDTSEIFDEVIEFDEDYYEYLKGKAKLIFEATEPPPRINNSPYWYKCKMCSYKKSCHDI